MANPAHRDFRIATANEFARLEQRYNSTLFQLFSIDQELVDQIGELCGALTVGHPPFPIALHIVELRGFKAPKVEIVRSPSRPVTLTAKLGELSLPDGKYLSICAPVVHTNTGTQEKEAREAIARSLGLFVASLGRGFLIGRAAEFVVAAGDELRQSFISDAIRAPQAWDFARWGHSTDLSDLAKAIELSDADLRSRIAYGASIFGRAALEHDDTFRFTLYWLALEVIADGGEKEVTGHLANAYNIDLKAVRDGLELRHCIRMRADLFHKGQPPQLTPRTERLLQGFFLDLLRYELGLPCNRLVEQLIASEARTASAGMP
ncbi:hypothetical protein [Hyphomicrobium sp.]|uniref:hypothetical protein n=1 Tax=Hyphomicrobium sp. TaxID=82 RepID=UPI0025BE70FB|nr:hypothetical protein [Hyphomicrobium sp.]MCC7251603.1 hypothetical protein [Hyphomicrobium sp.]